MNTLLQVDDKPYSSRTLLETLDYFIEKDKEILPFTFVDYTSGNAEDKSLSYRCIELHAKRIAALLQTRATKGDRVLLLYPAGLEYICAFFGCVYAGMIAVPVYPPLNERLQSRLVKVAENCGAKIALSNDNIISSLAFGNHIQNWHKKIAWLSTENGLEGFEHSWRKVDVPNDAIAFLQYTSGSTGSPKGVKISHRNLLHNLKTIATSLEYQSDDKHFSWLPPYHDMGFVGALLGSFAAGIPVSFMAPAAFLRKPARWLQEISKRQSTISGAPNFAYNLCIEKIKDDELENVDLSCWDLAFCGAEPVRKETLLNFSKRFASRGFNDKAYFPCYGMAETTLLVSGGERRQGMKIKTVATDLCSIEENSYAQNKNLVSCGKIAAEFDVDVIDPEKLCFMQDGDIGEIVIASDSVSSGYWDDEEKNSLCFNINIDNSSTKYFRTGDLGTIIDKELILCGRIKDVIIINGINYYPQDIESVVNECHPDIKKGCGIAFSIDTQDKENLVFVQEFNQNKCDDSDVMINKIRESISSEFSINPKYVVLIKNGSIPKTTSGKLARKPCHDKFIANELDVINIFNSDI